ncbi:MAG TPA: imidazoleglycerol-phosphate dehydratase HisB [Desulfobacteraceae bacterium]|nr:imidazoleglycerol-phosphate dehydratase HisB [Deltaproteobacteria bacterium]MBW2355644.1 imidazoleglycerol-phosphate dehydratase HisB [Deltaproteobacteria bacterium]RLB96162.1 MAG: imidazoleglycerol-phosphate dehydratase HisB [Deltaproteobacteria bacterium]HDI60216.1 imidazoleglycerol-phosphate dehydratase HisB [Desulfobacteraceae bacterium]
MADRKASVGRKTSETDIRLELNLDGGGRAAVSTGIGFFDHMLTLFAVHGFFDLEVAAHGDLEVDAHHTVEDVGLALGDAVAGALGDRRGIRRYGQAATPMDDALAVVTIDLSNRPFLVWHLPPGDFAAGSFDAPLAKEFFRALSNRGGMNLHVELPYGENGHHVLEAIFKSLGRALDQAVGREPRLRSVRSSKGVL